MGEMSRSRQIDYGIALAAVALAWFVRMLLAPYLGDDIPYPTFFIAVMISAWRGGLRPALLALVLSLPIALFFFVKPRHQFALAGVHEFVGVMLFVLTSLFLAVLSESLRQSRQASETMARQLLDQKQRLEAESAERLRAEVDSRRQREWFRVTFASIGDGVIVSDSAGKVMFLNPVAQELTGWTQEQAAGQPLPEVFRIVNEYTRAPVENPSERALREGRVVGLANHTLLIARDGSERAIDDSAAPIRDEKEGVQGVVLVFRDVTEKRRAELASSRLAALVESSADAIIGQNLEGVVTSWNAAAETMFGFRADEAIGKKLADTNVAVEYQEQLEDMLGRVKQGEKLDHIETVRRRKDGRLLDVSIRMSPIQTPEGIVGASAIYRDISARKAQERRRNARLAVTQILAAEQKIETAGPRVLKAVCLSLDWDLGCLWHIDTRENKLVCHEIWADPERDLKAFVSASGQLHLARGDTLPGLVWDAEEPIWVADIAGTDDFLRAEHARAANLHGAFACPIAVGEEFLGVIEFFSQEIREPDEDLLEMMTTLGGQVGLFIRRCRAEQDVRRSELILTDFFNNAPIGLHWVGPDGIVLRVNQAELDLLGYERDEYVGKHISEFHADQPIIDSILHRLTTGQTLNDQEARLRCKDGSIKHVLIVSNVYREKGAFVHTRCFTRDITQQKSVEGSLRESEERFRTLALNAPAAIFIKDLEGRYTLANQLASETMRRPEGIVGLTDHELLDAEVAEALRRHDQEVIDTGRPIERVEVVSGPNFDLRFLSVKFPMTDSRGQITGVCGVAVDITGRKRAEDRLRDSERRFATLTELIPEIIWTTQPDGEADYFNQRWFEYTGSSYEDSACWGWLEFIHPDDRERTRANWQLSLDQACPYEIEYRLGNAAGAYNWFLVRGVPVLDDHERIVKWFGTCANIDQQKRAEQEIRGAEERVRSVVDHAIDGIITIDEQGRVDSFNPGAERIFGYACAEVLGENVKMLMATPYREEHDNYLAHYLQTGQARIIGQGREVEGRRKNGATFPLDLSVSEFWLGPRRFFTGIVRDITERKRSEQSARFLAEVSASLASLVDYESTLQRVANLAVPFFADWCFVDIVENDGSLRRLAFAHANHDSVKEAERLQQRHPLEAGPRQAVSRVARTGQPEIVADVADEHDQADASDQRHRELIHQLGLRSYLCVPLNVRQQTLGILTFATAESGRSYGERDLALACDLADRAAIAIDNSQLYHALRDADRRKDEFLATLAHELRNPLAPISNCVEILRQRNLDDPQLQWVQRILGRQTQHLSRLVDDLLDVSRITRGKFALRKQPLELSEVVRRVVENSQHALVDKKLELEVSLPDEPLPMIGDDTRLEQILSNLVNNACKYSNPGGKISVSVENRAGQAFVSVRDTGAGIAPEFLPHVFDMFVQADRGSHGGLGIGLSLVRNLVEMHGGLVEAHSAGLGHGSAFQVTLPLAGASPADIEHDNKPSPAAPPAHSILVVDDNVDAADSLAALLRLQGHQVRVAHNGQQALEIAHTSAPRLMFLDIGMPNMDGYEVAQRLREMDHLHDAKLIAITGWGQEDDRRRSREAGFHHHIVKPITPEVLEDLILRIFNQ